MGKKRKRIDHDRGKSRKKRKVARSSQEDSEDDLFFDCTKVDCVWNLWRFKSDCRWMTVVELWNIAFKMQRDGKMMELGQQYISKYSSRFWSDDNRLERRGGKQKHQYRLLMKHKIYDVVEEEDQMIRRDYLQSTIERYYGKDSKKQFGIYLEELLNEREFKKVTRNGKIFIGLNKNSSDLSSSHNPARDVIAQLGSRRKTLRVVRMEDRKKKREKERAEINQRSNEQSEEKEVSNSTAGYQVRDQNEDLKSRKEFFSQFDELDDYTFESKELVELESTREEEMYTTLLSSTNISEGNRFRKRNDLLQTGPSNVFSLIPFERRIRDKEHLYRRSNLVKPPPGYENSAEELVGKVIYDRDKRVEELVGEVFAFGRFRNKTTWFPHESIVNYMQQFKTDDENDRMYHDTLHSAIRRLVMNNIFKFAPKDSTNKEAKYRCVDPMLSLTLNDTRGQKSDVIDTQQIIVIRTLLESHKLFVGLCSVGDFEKSMNVRYLVRCIRGVGCSGQYDYLWSLSSSRIDKESLMEIKDIIDFARNTYIFYDVSRATPIGDSLRMFKDDFAVPNVKAEIKSVKNRLRKFLLMIKTSIMDLVGGGIVFTNLNLNTDVFAVYGGPSNFKTVRFVLADNFSVKSGEVGVEDFKNSYFKFLKDVVVCLGKFAVENSEKLEEIMKRKIISVEKFLDDYVAAIAGHAKAFDDLHLL